MTCDRAVMVNLLGFETAHHDYAEQRSRLAQIPNAHLYWYNKSASRPGRKLGHVTVTPPAATDLPRLIQQVESCWYPIYS
jgi:5-(carboxyamino)imidazole ribonucleotide synthase